MTLAIPITLQKKLCWLFTLTSLILYAELSDAQDVFLLPDTAKLSEKVHLHMDKSHYAAGDTIWFKAYLVEEANLPLTPSGTLYVELINEKDSISNRRVLPVVNGISFGSLPLGVKTISGYYRIRAYTQMMAGNGPESFYDKVVVIGDVKSKKLSATTAATVDLQFLPEGGNLLAGLPVRIAFKAATTNGHGVDVRGKIVDNHGIEVAVISRGYQGMGSFVLTPHQEATYTAIMDVNGSEKKITLPAVQQSGYSLSVSVHDTTQLVIRSMCTEDLLNSGQLKLILHKSGIAYVNLPFTMEKQVTKMSIPTSGLPQGIMQVSLTDAKGHIVCERIVFIGQERRPLSVVQTGLASSYGKRGATQIALRTMLGDRPVLNGSFSVAVTNSDIAVPDYGNESHILSSLLLSSELKGHIENPNLYFRDSSDSTRAHLDLLMMTQGWRKVWWHPVHVPEKAISITGIVSDGKGPVAGAEVTLMRTGEEMGMEQMVTNSDGRFSFDLVYLGKARFLVQAKSPKSKWLRVVIDSVPQMTVPVNGSVDYLQNDTLAAHSKYVDAATKYNQQRLSKESIVLKEVKIKGGKRIDNLPSGQPLNTGHIFQVISPKDLVGVEDIMDYLRGHLGGGVFIGMNDYGVMKPVYLAPVLVGGKPTREKYLSEVGVVVNDQFIDEYFDLAVLPVKEIEKIQLYRLPPPAPPYVMTISMKDKKVMYQNFRKAVPPGTAYLNREGYTLTKEFYQVRYPLKNDNSNEDNRTTLYWAPHLTPDKYGEIKFDYFNGDLTGKHRIVLEGIDGQGNLLRKEWEYNVKE